MADIMLHTNSASSVTCVSNIFIDDFMKDANGEYVKIYLYLLRCLGRDDFEFSISEVADRLDHTEKDVLRAFAYWEKVGLLHLEYSEGELSGICLVDVTGYEKQIQPVVTNIPSVTFNAPAAKATAAGAPVTAPKAVKKPSYSVDEVSAFSSQDEVQDLLFVASTYIGRPISQKETESILFWYSELHMSMELIEYLIESCIDNNHKSFHYMNTVAINWTEDGIKTPEDAKASSMNHNNTVYSIMKALGISGRDLIPDELSYIEKWVDAYHFDIEIICEACKRAVLATNKPSFKYADSILTSWSKNDAKTLEDVAKLDEAHITSTVSNFVEKKTAAKAAPKRKAAGSKWDFENTRPNDGSLDELEKSLLKM